MPERFAIYYAPGRDAALWQLAEGWLTQPDLAGQTISARRYRFHATLKAPMELAPGADLAQLEMAVADFAGRHGPVAMGQLSAHLIDGFVALTPVSQPQALTDFAATVVTAFEGFRAPMEPADRERRLRAPLSPRQIELVDLYGYPYVLEEFQFHMTLTDRLVAEQREPMRARAGEWFAAALAAPVALDRLVLFHEAEPGAAFQRLDDFALKGSSP